MGVRLDVLLSLMVVQLDGALDGHVAGVGRGGWRDPCPEDDAVRVRIARGDAVGEVELGRLVRHVAALHAPAGDDGHVDAEVDMAGGGAVVVEVAVEGGGCQRGGQSREAQEGEGAHPGRRGRGICQVRVSVE